jgi:DNA-binding IclR family transcriptional regulator
VTDTTATSARLIQSVDRALTLLAEVAERREPSSGPDLARAAGVNRSTAWRLLATLEHHQLIDRDPRTGHYTIGHGVARLARHVDDVGLIRRARPVLERLSRDSSESTALSIARRARLAVIDQVTVQNVVAVQWIGREIPLHTSSAGKLLLAALPPAELDLYLSAPLEACTARTIVDADRLREELELVRERGIGTTFGEYEIGLNGFSAAVRDASGHPTAFISVTGPDYRLGADRLQELEPLLLEAVADVAAALRVTSA